MLEKRGLMFYLAKWKENSSGPIPYWHVPGASAIVDIRSNAKGNGFAIAKYDQGSAPVGSQFLGNTFDDIADDLTDRLTRLADPTGQTGPRPLMPGRDGHWKLHLGGDTRIWKPTRSGPIWDATLANLHQNYKDIRARVAAGLLPPDFHRRMLTMWEEKYHRKYTAFIPVGYAKETPLFHETLISDDFSGTLGAWTQDVGTWAITGGRLNPTNTPAGGSWIHHNMNLSSDDHYAQAKLWTAVASSAMTLGRFADANNFYAGYMDTMAAPDDIYIYERVGAAWNSIATKSFAWTPAETLRLEIDGSSLSLYVEGSLELGPSTDTSLSGQTLAGFYNGGAGRTNVDWDDFEAADLQLSAPRVMHHRKMIGVS